MPEVSVCHLGGNWNPELQELQCKMGKSCHFLLTHVSVTCSLGRRDIYGGNASDISQKPETSQTTVLNDEDRAISVAYINIWRVIQKHRDMLQMIWLGSNRKAPPSIILTSCF